MTILKVLTMLTLITSGVNWDEVEDYEIEEENDTNRVSSYLLS